MYSSIKSIKREKTEFIKIEEFLEQILAPPRYPHLSSKYKESFDMGCNLFAKFSAYIKNMQKEANKIVTLTLADCSLLAKLNIIKVGAMKYHDFDIPAEFSGVWRYLHNVYAHEECAHICPEDKEIENMYVSLAKQ
ncbi:chloride intracellular channel protein 2 [Microtus pennsylvanicus]|uniref:chloride intracellular channel protein 2 n=1 Tax=Microtus pennsylvanicus TaxID=10058 RepID=UPI003F6C7424